MKSTFWTIALVLCSVAVGQTAPAAQTPAPAPAPAKAASTKPPREGIDDMFSVSLFMWKPSGQPGFRPGPFVPDPTSSTLNLTKDPSRANGAMVTIPTGGFNRLEIGYWRAYDAGDLRAPNKMSIFGANIANNELLNTYYRLSNIRVAWNYLTYPVPPFNTKLRLKSFWEFQYTKFQPTLNFPEAKNSPAPLTPKQSVRYPGFGLGVEYIPSKHFRLEARGSGMAFKGRSGYYDIEASAVARIKKVEVFGGMKGYHFHTTPHNQNTYTQGTLWGPSFGLRYVIW